MTPVLIDCDPGIDDAVALMLACAAPGIELRAVTAVAGNRPLETTAANACRVLDAAGRSAVPVFAGCTGPLVEAEPCAGLIHGENGLGGVTLPLQRRPGDAHASDVIARTLLEAPAQTVTVVAIGPLSNLALAEIKHRGLLRRAKALLVMGGAAFRPGNMTPAAEFNFFADPLAAHTVLSAGAPLHLFGLDVTGQTPLPDAWVAALAAPGNLCGRAARDMLRHYAAQHPRLHDACPLAWLLEPALFSGEPCAVAVDWRPGPTAGHLGAWPMSHRRRPQELPQAMVYTEVDGARLLTLIQDAIASLP